MATYLLYTYLKSIDPQRRPWTWQLKNICQVHFKRSETVKASPGISRFYSLHSVLMSLLDCDSGHDGGVSLCNTCGHDLELNGRMSVPKFSGANWVNKSLCQHQPSAERAYIELIDCLQGTVVTLNRFSVARRLDTNKYYIIIYIGHNDETVRNWAQHRRRLFIRAGLNKYCSLIPTEYYDSVRNIINAVEQTHFKSYATEKYTTLLSAIFK
jgi:hypothetical protein